LIPELRRDPLSGRWVALAPWRAQRPGATQQQLEPETQEELDTCPFCAGREDQTPPESFALGRPGREPNTPGWTVRVVPNKYPAFEHHEVVIHTPRHARMFGELTATEVDDVAAAWQARADAARAAGFVYLQAVLNEGRAAGGSLSHTHSQLVWLPEPPPLVREESTGDCPVCALLGASERIAERDGVLLVSPFAARGAYELLITPEEHTGDAFADSRLLTAALGLLASGEQRIAAVEGRLPTNAWLHTAPFGGEGHWHLEVLPRVSAIASLELGAGVWINSLAPEVAAERLRGAG
jgi:UDPglucose--hexose-1-phosphate uridylyltransferase